MSIFNMVTIRTSADYPNERWPLREDGQCCACICVCGTPQTYGWGQDREKAIADAVRRHSIVNRSALAVAKAMADGTHVEDPLGRASFTKPTISGKRAKKRG